MLIGRVSPDIDLIEELRLRRWARENYVPHAQRANDWHPVVLDEMDRKDRDLAQNNPAYATVA